MKKLKKIIIGACILLLTPFVVFAAPFNSAQLGTGAVNGYYLKTNGFINTWAAVASGGGSGIGWASTTVPDSNSIFSTQISNVGIGTTSPYAKLSVVGEVVAANFTATSTTATSTFTNGVFRGRVGIGTLTPTSMNTNAKLSVAGNGFQVITASTSDNTTSSAAIFETYAQGVKAYLGSHADGQTALRFGKLVGGWGEIAATSTSGTMKGLMIGTPADAPIIFGTNNIQRAMIASTTGYMGIATTTATSTLDVYGSFSTKVTGITATTTLDGTMSAIAASTTNAVGINLPPIAGVCGRIYSIQKINEAGQLVTLDPSGAELIDGTSTVSYISKGTRMIQASCSSNPSQWVTVADHFDSLKYYISVADYGAIPNDGISDTVAIQAALNNAATSTRKTVFIPDGVYDITRTEERTVSAVGNYGVNIPSGVTLMGASRLGTILILASSSDFVGSSPVIIASSTTLSNTPTYVSVQRMTIDGRRASNTPMTGSGGGESECINWKNAHYTWIQDVEIRECGDDGIDIDNGDHNFISNFYVHDINGHGFHMSTDFTFISNGMIKNNGFYRYANGNGSDLVSGSAAGMDTYSGQQYTISDVYFEDNVRNFTDTGASYVTISNSRFQKTLDNTNNNIIIGENKGGGSAGSNIVIQSSLINGPYNSGASTSTVLVQGRVTKVTLQNNTILAGRAIQSSIDNLNILGGRLESQDNNFYQTSGNDVTISGVDFNTATNFSHIRQFGGSRLNVINNVFQAAGSISVYIVSTSSAANIFSNTFYGTSANNVYLNGGTNVVQNNIMQGDMTLDASANNTVSNNTFRNLTFITSGVTGNKFFKNNITGTLDPGSAATSSQTWNNNYSPLILGIPNYMGDNNVGIATSSPYASLSVAGSGGIVANKIFATSTNATSTFMGGVTIGSLTSTRGLLDIQQYINTSSNGFSIANLGATGSTRIWTDVNDNSRFDGGSSGNGVLLFNGSGTGKTAFGTTTAKRPLVVNGDIYSATTTANDSGVILKATDDTCHRLVVSAVNVVSATTVSCP